MKLFSILFSMLLLAGCAIGPEYAIIPEADRGYTAIIEVPDVSKEVLFNRASEWIAITYVSGKEVIQERNPKTGRIIGRCVTSAKVDDTGLIDVYWDSYYSLVVDIKDGKARIQLGNYKWVEHGNAPSYAKFVNPITENMRLLATEFESFLKTGTGGAVVGVDDW